MALVYLEDFLELVEELPNDFKHSFAQLRSLDLRVQNTLDSIDRKKRKLFASAATMSQPDLVKAMTDVVQEYDKARTAADEKRQMATSSCEMMDRVLKYLDGRLEEFTDELRNINPGVIPRLEQRSLELDDEARKQSAEAVAEAMPARPAVASTSAAAGAAGAGAPQLNFPGLDPALLANITPATAAAAFSAAAAAMIAARNATASAASPAMGEAATPATGTPTAAAARQSASTSRKRKLQAARAASVAPVPVSTTLELPTPAALLEPEPLYCICRQVSFGQMVGCDNEDCPVEWFHYDCVGLTEEPKGSWYCPYCSDKKKKGKRG